MNFDVNLIKRMLNHGRLDETSYPSGLDGHQPAAVGGMAKNHQTNNMGDNPMVDPAYELEEENDSDKPTWFIVPRFGDRTPVEEFTQKQDAIDAGYDTRDYAIKYGYMVNEKFNAVAENASTLAAALPIGEEVGTSRLDKRELDTLTSELKVRSIGLDVVAMEDFGSDGGNFHIGWVSLTDAEVIDLVQAVSNKVMPIGEANVYLTNGLQTLARGINESLGGSTDQELIEFRADDAPVDARFTHVIDSLGHVMVRDTKTGREIYLQGSEALELIGELPDGASLGQIQQVLSGYQHVMEDGLGSQQTRPRGINGVKTSIVGESLRDLLSDAQGLDSKLQAMKQGARKTGDSVSYFAFEHFEKQVKTLSSDLQHYIEQFTKN